MNSWDWAGSRWWKFDFHTHTPASEDYGKGPDQEALRTRSPKDWLLDYMRAGIDCIAVTDHNSGAWIDKLKEAQSALDDEKPNGFKPIYLFPGVEISANPGVHVIAILDPSKSTSDVDSLLGAVGFVGTKGKSDHVTSKSVQEVLFEIKALGGIAVPAHVDNVSGLFTISTGPTLIQALDRDLLAAIEVVDPQYQKPQAYHDKKLRLAEVLGSDSHHPNGTSGQFFPGSHYTWIKMGTPDLGGLQLALLDGSLSVHRSDQVSSDPNKHANLVIEEVIVENAKYMGRSQAFKLRLNPWLNTIIGGRGTGKSTLVEFMRTTLCREAELPVPLSVDFEKYRRVYQDRDDDGLLTEHAKFTITYSKDRTRFRIHWNAQGDADPIEIQLQDGTWRSDQGDVSQRFPVRIYSQKQIFELAKAPLALLRIVDEAPEVDHRAWSEEWKQEETNFLALRARAREIESGLADESRLRGELEDLKRRLSIFEESGHADVLKEYQKRVRQERGVEAWEEQWSQAADKLRGVAKTFLPDPLDATLFEPQSQEGDEIQQKAADVLGELKGVRDQLEEIASATDEITSRWQVERKSTAWQRAVHKSIQGYETLKQQLTDEGFGDPSAYGEFVSKRQILERRLEKLEPQRVRLAEVRRAALKSFVRLKKRRQELTKRRTKFLETVLAENPYVRIDVVPYGARETVEGDLRQLLQREGGGFERDIKTLMEQIYANNVDPLVTERNLKAAKKKINGIAAGDDDTELGDRRFSTHIRKLQPEALDRLALWFPEDSLRVEYSTTADGTGFRSIQEGSPGQKTAALLAFLFSYGEEPIILDQPEDDLDNELIYELIVGQIRQIKQKRQVIVVTHNANIVVNGDAELVAALVARVGETRKSCAGCLQERTVRDTICSVMEGGREAFDERYRRIALEVRP